MNITERITHAWNAFMNKDPTPYYGYGSTYSYSLRPDRVRFTRGNEKTIVTSVYNRIAMDSASIDIFHARMDESNRFLEPIDSALNNCLRIEANIDQTGRAFMQDVVMSMFDNGVVAIVPVDTTIDPMISGSYDINSLRTGEIMEWFPDRVKVKVYNERIGQKEEIILPKKMVGIVENPLFSVVNEPNSVAKRLVRKLAILDAIDEESGSGKLNLIIQLPYTVKTDLRHNQAEKRRTDVEEQLTSSKYGVAYIDGTEKVIQLNRSVENNLMSQIEYLTNMLYSQLGVTQTIMDGSADDKTMLNYYNRTIEPILSAITEEMRRKFLTKKARSQHQSIVFFRDPFKLVPVADLAEISDKMTRNEIMTSNEIRQVIGMRPSDDPKADELRNSNLSEPAEQSSNNSTNLAEQQIEKLEGVEIQNG